MFDVVLDLRPGSDTFGKWYGTELTAENGRMLYVPEHCGHGYQTLEDNTEMYYMTSAFYAPVRRMGHDSTIPPSRSNGRLLRLWSPSKIATGR